MRGRWRPVLVAALAAAVVAALGATMTDLGPWYRGLDKPPWQPPDESFGIVWTIVFATTAASGLMAWRAAQDRSAKEWVVGLYALNGFLNVLWSLIFFRLQRPDIALVQVAVLWASILFIAIHVRRMSRTASLLMLPYLAWVTFAAALNGAVVARNAPFG
jgi:benzodiazapine receptor